MSETRFLSTSLSPSQDLVQRAQSQCNRDSKRDITSWLPMAPRRSKSSKEKDTPTAEGWFLVDHRQRNGKVIKVCMCLCISGKVSFAWRLMSIIVVQLSLSRDATENFGLYCFGAPRGPKPHQDKPKELSLVYYMLETLRTSTLFFFPFLFSSASRENENVTAVVRATRCFHAKGLCFHFLVNLWLTGFWRFRQFINLEPVYGKATY